MFRKALSIAPRYTRPVVLSRKTVKGDCSSSIGAFVVVNDEGWIITAYHILEQLGTLTTAAKQATAHKAQYDAIRNDKSLAPKDKKRRFSKLKKLPSDATDEVSAWWARDGVGITDAQGLKDVDLAVGRLEPFDPSWVDTYPTFKDPAKDFLVGTSLCKLGYPFHSIKPTWHEDKRAFVLPQGSLPLPMFPIEGIFARVVNVKIENNPPPYPYKFIETSSPGLKGQSGGPILDTEGAIWAIQSHTAHFHLGFNPEVPGNKRGQREQQFLNVGRGVHVETILGFLRQIGINFQLSNH